MEEKRATLEIKIDPETAQGSYSNFAAISHSNTSFVIDFIFIQPQAPKGKVFSRIITSPQHAKRFLKALSENIEKFESHYGPISVTETKEEHITPQGMDYYH